MTALRIRRVHVDVPRGADTTAAVLLALTEGSLMLYHWFVYGMSGFSGDPEEVTRAGLSLSRWSIGLAVAAALCSTAAHLLGLRRTAWTQVAALVAFAVVAGVHP
jgi:hypothetical protein